MYLGERPDLCTLASLSNQVLRGELPRALLRKGFQKRKPSHSRFVKSLLGCFYWWCAALRGIPCPTYPSLRLPEQNILLRLSITHFEQPGVIPEHMSTSQSAYYPLLSFISVPLALMKWWVGRQSCTVIATSKM